MDNTKKIVIISPKNRTVYNFRGDLIRDLQKTGYEVVVTGPDKENLDRILDLGVRFELIPMNKDGINPFADIKYLWSLMSLLRKEMPCLTLEYTIKPVIYGSIAAKLAGIKNINSLITGTGFLFTSKSKKARILKKLVLGLYKTALACSTHVIFQNPDDLDEFIQTGLVNQSKTAVVNGSGVNMNHFQRCDYPQQTTFFMLGRLLHSKGVMEYLQAAKIVKESYPEVRIMLLGKIVHGMADAIAEENIKPYLDNGTIELFDETNDVRPYYSKTSVFVLPSYREGTPRSVLEAMSMGRPIITCDTPGCRGTVVDGENGFLVPIKDANALASAMMKFVKSPELIARMGQKSYEYCSEKFEVGKVNVSMLNYMGISVTD